MEGMPERSKPHREMYDEHLSKLDAHLRSANLPTKQAKRYRSAALRVLNGMTEQGITRLRGNLTAYYFYPNPEALEAEGRRETAGFYRPSNGSIHLDGGEGDESIPNTYAHEYAHALDGPDDEISGSEAWQEAWREEMVEEGAVSDAAAVSAEEGWAELGELMLRGRRDEAREMCPKCVQIWEGLGL